jgi:hypothetical protein
MPDRSELEELHQQLQQLQDTLDETQAWCAGLEQHVVRLTAKLRVLGELVKGR